MMNNLTLPVIFAATLDSGLRRNDGMGFACLRANTHRQAGMTVDTSLTSGARADATNGLTTVTHEGFRFITLSFFLCVLCGKMSLFLAVRCPCLSSKLPSFLTHFLPFSAQAFDSERYISRGQVT